MNEVEPVLTSSLTYLLPMREDLPGFANFQEVRSNVAAIMGENNSSPRVTRLCTFLAGNGIVDLLCLQTYSGIQEDGRPGSVKAVTFYGTENSPLTVARQMKQKGIGPHAGRLLLDFAINLQTYYESSSITSID